ncbi:putative Ig domain-containing protein [Nostoc sp. 'Peltigera membranacea cyanobiont' 232]|uniref:putative Ig domain-containing protein n=1 Tax=Nostoc sp. 'Peltigera membranacea cyanobiont' 232 TaxID=2014531 RepID=UPI001671F01F|nr:putative Ig domain-containing protein [Nostoc sp. 'Peltigera membranacea cyanobiont' 232]
MPFGQDPRYDTAPTVLTQSGNYKLQVYNGYNAPTTIAAFQLLQLPKTLGPGTNYLQMDSPVTGILNHAESKVYTFQGVNGLKILLNGMAGATNYTLYDSSGRQVFTQYNPGGYYWQPPVWADSSLYTLTQNDLYHLVVSNISGADNNPYSFEVLETANVQSVNYGIPIADSLTDGRLDSIYKIKANLGDNLFFDSITTNAPNGNYRWKLYDPGNQLLFNNDLRTDASVTISETGDYYLEVEGGPDTNQINYQFRVFSYTPTANTIITPGAGGTSSSDPNALGVFSVQLGVKDGKGGTDVQNYKIRVGADPEDHNPVISSNPETRFALTDDAYRYSVKAIDADGDKLSYRLVNSPIGALINKDTGELLWFPDSNVAVGGKANFTVEVSDERGGKDSQSFSVDIYQSLGTIQGAVFNDLNANGLLDSKLITGDNPSIVFAIDVSGSTIAPFHGNGKYKDVKTVLDAEKAAIQATIDAIIAMGGGDKVKISFIPFTNDGTIQDMNPAAHTGLVTYTTAFADLDNNSIPDYLQILNSYTSGGSSKFTQVAQKIDTLINVLPGTPNVIYMSDGYGYLDPTVAKTLANDVKSKGGNLNAFAIGSASTYSTLQELDPYAIQVVDINELTDIFSGFDDRYAKEPFMNGVTVYLDQNNNGQLDPGESYQITQQDKIPNSLDINSKYYFSFKNLLPGTYTVRTLLPSGYTMTSPTTNVWTDTITAAGETNNNLFGITQATIVPPNQNPVFVTTPPAITLLKADQQLRYNAFARDPDANIVTYDLITAPEGMAVLAHDGIVVWSPTSTQVEKYYQDLYAEQARLTAIGRGAYAPTHVEFNVLLRATDGQGGQALQYLKVQLVPNNHPPVFTSTSPNNLQPQVGKPFQYQTTATDPDNDSVTFSLVNPPSGAVINGSTGLLTWTPTANQLGNQQFSIQVQDSFGNSNLQSVNLTVVLAHVNHSPVFTSTPRTSTRTQNPYIYNLQATDPDNDPLTFSLVNAPAGMTLNQGVLVWQPTASQFGNNSVSVQVSDGQGGTTTQNWTIQVSNQLSNLPPTITSTPSTVTSLGRTYIYKPTAIDSDGDRLTWSLVSDTVPPPQGMVIDEETGTIVWQPTANQIGDTTVRVQATDIYGAYNVQEFTIHVNGINSPPKFVSTPITIAGVGQGYSYQALATDPENDALIFTLGSKPSGMTITKDGLIQWTPTANQVGKYDIQVIATDDQGASTNQTYTLIAGTTPVNHPPVISSTPVFLAAVGHAYNYQVAATDADNNPITYQLLSAPDGMTIDANTGLLTWANPVAGSYQVVVGADDGKDGAAQGFTLIAKTITPPIIQSTTPPNNAIPNTLYRYDIIAFDPQGDRLTYSIDAASQNLGMILDSQGRLSWTPTSAQVGDHTITLTVSDSAGFNTQQTFNLNVTPDTVAPKVKLIASYDSINLGESITFQARATDNIKLAGLQLLIDGTAVVLDANGMARFTPTKLGTIIAKAIATDAAGNPATATFSVAVIDSSDVNPPDVSLNLRAIAQGTVTAPVEIKGTVSDDNLDYYRLLVAPIGSSDFKEIFRGTSTVNNDVLGRFDPSLLENDSYTLRLEAHDKGGNVSFVEDTVNVSGELKLGNFRLSFTDLSIPVTGIPITLTRTYDSLTSGSTDDFGYGWRMEFRDTDLRTSVGKPTGEVAELGGQNPFKDGTKVYITLPGGKREGFTFRPTIDPLSQYLRGAGGVDSDPNIYHPSFVADAGVTDTLTVQNTRIIHGAGTNQYYGLAGSAYNPADTYYGGVYTLTTKEGIVYQIDAATGDLLTVTDTNGNTLTYTDADITSSTGQKITFGRDAQGRIATVTDPTGKQIRYEYDAKGDLVAETDREGNTTKFVYDSTQPHYLAQVIDPLGKTGVRNEYGDDGRLKKMVDAAGASVQLAYDPSHSTETITDALGNPTTYEYDERGNVVTEIDALGGIITRSYDQDNNLLKKVDPDGVSTTYTYDSKGNPLTITDRDGNVTRITYNQYGETLNIISPRGLTVSSTYDKHGNLLSRTNTDGQTTTFSYDGFGRLIKQTAPDNEVSTYTYDDFGNPTVFTDSRGNQAIATYDLNGKVKTLSMVFPQENQTLNTSYTYDNQGRTTSVTNPQGNVTTTEYDAKGNVIATTDIKHNRTQYFYDDKGQQIKVILPDNTPNNPDDNPVVLTEYDVAGRVISQTSATKLKTRYVYDELGRLTDTILPDLTPDNPDDNPREKIEYTAGDRIQAKIDIFGTRTEYTYDNLGRVSRERDFFGNSTGNDTTYIYNADGQVTSVTDARNRTTLIGIDDKGRASQTTYFDGTTSQVTYDALGRTKSETNQLGQTTSYNYDVFGKVAAITNPLNQQTQFTYNSRGSLVKVTDALNHSTGYEYDQYNRQTAVINANGDRTETTYDQYGQVAAVKDGNQHITQYFYDNLGALTSVKLANQATTNYTYDNLGRLTQFEDANHNKTTYQYDAFNRQVATNLPLGQRSTTTFNNFGQVANTKDFNDDVITYAYDQYGRLANKSFSNPLVATVSYTYDPVTSQVKTVTDGRGVTSYGFDSYDRVNLISNPDGQTASYTYDVLGNLKTLTTSASTVNYSYDVLNRLDTVTSGGQLAKYGYDAAGNLISTALADGTTQTQQYDASNRLKSIETRDALGGILSSYAYILDGVGNRTQVIEDTGRTVNYTYDEVNQLKLESITDPNLGNRTIGYDYDLVGNRLKRNDSDPSSGLTTYIYDPNNRLTSQTSGTKVTRYTYDNNGSMLTSDDGINSVVYQWINDGENRLIGVTTTNASGSSQSKYIYDASGNRVASITDGVRKNYLVDPRGYSKVLQEYDANGQILTKYFYGLGLIKSESGSDERFYHSDGLGSTRLLTDGTGQVTDRYVYDAFGRLIAHAGGSGNAYQFAGEQRDSTGLDYLRARYYNSDLGRFISKDAFAGHLASPISENAYVYANANPVNFTDPSGYESLGELSAAEAINSILSSIPYASIGQGILGGALFGLAYGLIKQDAELIEGRRSEVSWTEVLESTYQGAVFGGLFSIFPLAGAFFAAAGVAGAIDEARSGHFLSAAVDLAFILGPLASKEGSEPILKQIEEILNRNNIKVSINENSSGSVTISLPEGVEPSPQETVTVFRVQGGEPPLASRRHIVIDANGNPKINRTTLNISIGDPSHAEHFLSRRPGADITSFEIPNWMADFIDSEAIPQANYRTNPLNQGGLAPKVVDPTTPGLSYELPSIWAVWLEEVAIPGSGKVTGGNTK